MLTGALVALAYTLIAVIGAISALVLFWTLGRP